MLTEQRYELILKLLEEKQSITAAELKELLHTSESTVRRDITALHNAGRLKKVFGGAVALEQTYTVIEPTVAQKVDMNKEEKRSIARYAASFLEERGLIYLDAGTTTGYMLEHINQPQATYVTNAVAHAQKLAAKGLRVILIGGELKSTTEAVVGSQAMELLKYYHFHVGFFGTNGITAGAGLTTPDANEALVKKTAMQQCRKAYVLADHTKFGQISSVTFASFKDSVIVTDLLPEGYEDCGNILIPQEVENGTGI